MDCFCSIFQIGKKVWEATGGCCINFINLDINMNRLKLDTNYLDGRAKDTNAQLGAMPAGKIKKEEVEAWLEEVQDTKEDVQRFEKEFEEERNFFKRVWLAQQVQSRIDKVAEVKDKGKFPDGLVIDAPPPKGMLIPMEDFFSKAASAKNYEKVRKYLTEHKFTRIGVVGMGGAGKTTVMKQIHNEMIEGTADYFDQVIWVTVSKEFSIVKIQNSIAKQLCHNKNDYEQFEESKDEMERKMALCTIFSTKKRYLLILDDVWEVFHLDMIGVSNSSSVTIVSTTRSKKVCVKMDFVPVEIELLTEQEAKDLFMKTVALPEDKLAPKVKDIAETVAIFCGRLPLAIITVARNMRREEDLHAWREQLRKISRKEIRDDERDVLELLKFSYSRLRNEKFQKCFLYCAMYPEDFYIPENELIKHWIVEGLIDEMDSREAMFDEGYFILNELINVYLLERCPTTFSFGINHENNNSYVRMHDLIREMSLQIISIGSRFVIHSGYQESSDEVLFDVWSQDPEKVSLMDSEMSILPSNPPICRRLTTLLLGWNYYFRVIPDSFFSHMSRLKVLNLSYTRIRSLPKSISDLENLHALFAGHCLQLEYVPSLEKLKELKELDLCESRIQEIPQGLENLINLRNLDLFGTEELEEFPGWKLRRLSKLQRFRIDRSRASVSAEDLLCLSELEVVGVWFQNRQELISYLKSQQCQRLEKYHLHVKSRLLGGWRELENIGKDVWVEMYENVVDRIVLPNNVESSAILGYKFHDTSDIPWRDARDLRKLALLKCHGIEFIFSTPSSSSSENSQIPLRSLLDLILIELPNLTVLFRGVVPPHNISFKLAELRISGCSGIKNIFPAMLLQNYFPNLRFLDVSHCENVKEIIVDEAVDELSRKTITLPNLESLLLANLPALESIHKGIMVCKSLKGIEVDHCPMLKRLPLSCLHPDGCQQQASPPPELQLEFIRGSTEWWESLEWDDPYTKTALEPFCQLWWY